MMDVTIPMIHTTGINTPVVAINVKIVNFMMTPSFPSSGAGLAMAQRRFRSRPPASIAFSPLYFLYSINHAKMEKPA